jgi:hypothetical protein
MAVSVSGVGPIPSEHLHLVAAVPTPHCPPTHFVKACPPVGDAVEGDRIVALGGFEADLARIFDGATPSHPVLRPLAPR